MTKREQIMRLAKFSNDEAENRAAYFHLDNPQIDSTSQSHYIGERTENARLLPLITAMAERIETLEAALEEQRKSNSHTELEINKIKEKIYPNIESCDCEAPCSCTYPGEWILLTDLPYHCAGANIMIDEALTTKGPLEELLEEDK